MSGGNGDGKTPTSANFLSGMLGSLPPFEEMFKMAGLELPDYLVKKSSTENVEIMDKIEDVDSTDEADTADKE